ncbi:hypothetical protein HJG60_009559 [Phyllostomus discolor]|uniref:Uncharacterized protein n=1 Tax=Phyllostomus discolor TaxID=89673 RepID=A0A834D6B6_9CHIR|nr:hypothetical protein HJG60_009559 [Phyllostomus discolor]
MFLTANLKSQARLLGKEIRTIKTMRACLPGLLPNASKIMDVKMRRLTCVTNIHVTDAGGLATILRECPAASALAAATTTRSRTRLLQPVPALGLTVDPCGLSLNSKCPWSAFLSAELSPVVNATHCGVSHQFYSIQRNLSVIHTHVAWFMFWNFLHVPPPP